MNDSRAGAIALVVSNAFIFVGIFAFGWNLSAVVLLYWIEILMIGFVTIAKMGWASQKGVLGKSRSYQVIFFIAHYATFCVLYGIVLQRFVVGPEAGLRGLGIAYAAGVALFALSHGLSLKFDYLDRPENRQVSSMMQMLVPYLRLAPPHVILVALGSYLARSGPSPAALAVLVAAVALAELFSHRFEYRALTRILRSSEAA